MQETAFGFDLVFYIGSIKVQFGFRPAMVAKPTGHGREADRPWSRSRPAMVAKPTGHGREADPVAALHAAPLLLKAGKIWFLSGLPAT